jgi:outer membrane immunogenic protein
MKMRVSGLAVFAAALVCWSGVAEAETSNSVLKDDGPGLPILPVNGPGEFAWSGLYAGVSLGAAWGESTQNYDRAGDHGAATLEPSGGAASITAGYNWMLGPHWVAGIEGDLGIMNASQGATTVFDGHVWSSDIGPLWGTMRARAGYLVSDDVLAFATGGVAVADINDTSIGNTPGETAIEDGMRFGLAVGAGVEYAWNESWTLKAEFLHLNFAEADGQSTNAEDYTFDDHVNLLRVGANMRF